VSGLILNFNGTLWNLFVAWMAARVSIGLGMGRDCMPNISEPKNSNIDTASKYLPVHFSAVTIRPYERSFRIANNRG
jgi:hypothetical protein